MFGLKQARQEEGERARNEEKEQEKVQREEIVMAR